MSRGASLKHLCLELAVNCIWVELMPSVDCEYRLRPVNIKILMQSSVRMGKASAKRIRDGKILQRYLHLASVESRDSAD
ncbi:hypothetical protein CVS40_11783 [Lucilia cuprina]|nr:hypothetical protein CVS40_11783 [Lucilia cuprina]